MVQENPEDIFEQLATKEPARETEELDDVGGDYDRPLEDYEKTNANLTDLQYLIKTLSPDFKDDVYNYFMYARLSPETFIPLFRLAVNSEVKRHNPRQRVEVVRVAMKLYTILTKALDGKHIIDILEAFGSKADNSEIDALSKGMGG